MLHDVQYNAVLRGFPADAVAGLKGNKYTTTIHALVSGIKKIQRVSPIPESGFVYRGIGGMKLGDDFMKKDKKGVSGVSY